MNWLFPSMTATLIGTILLALVFLYLYLNKRELFLRDLFHSWMFYAFRFVFMLVYLYKGKGEIFFSLAMSMNLIHVFFMVQSAHRLKGRNRSFFQKVPLLVLALWPFVSLFIPMGFYLKTFPVFIFSGFIYIYIGFLFYNMRKKIGKLAIFISIVFILWGLHKLDYPFLWSVERFSPIGYMLGAVFEICIAFSIILVYYEQLEHNLRHSSKKLNILYNSLNIAIWEEDLRPINTWIRDMKKIHGDGLLDRLKDEDRAWNQLFGLLRPLRVNRKCLELFQARDFLHFRNEYHRLFDHESISLFRYMLQAVLHEEPTMQQEGCLLDFHGNRIIASVTMILDQAEQKLVFSFLDLTRVRQLHSQLVHSEKLSALGQLAAGVAHEFNNLLSVISGNIELLKIDHPESDIQNICGIIQEQISRGAGIAGNMLSFSAPQKPKLEICRVSDLIGNVLDLESSFLKLENIKIETDFSKQDYVIADKGQSQQIFLNLVHNARHAMLPKKGGTLSIRTQVSSGKIICSLQDTGIGMDPSILNRIFDPFFTTKGARAKDNLGITGTGLGLSLTHSIIKNHGGSIRVESEPGQGTLFVIEFPAVGLDTDKKKSDNLKPDKGSNLLSGKKVALVDDEAAIVTFLTSLLENLGGKEIYSFNSAESFLPFVESESLDLVILDLCMPGMGGRDLLKWIERFQPGLRVLIISGQIGAHGFIGQTGNLAFLQKPFGMGELISKIRELFEKD